MYNVIYIYTYIQIIIYSVQRNNYYVSQHTQIKLLYAECMSIFFTLEPNTILYFYRNIAITTIYWLLIKLIKINSSFKIIIYGFQCILHYGFNLILLPLYVPSWRSIIISLQATWKITKYHDKVMCEPYSPSQKLSQLGFYIQQGYNLSLNPRINRKYLP